MKLKANEKAFIRAYAKYAISENWRANISQLENEITGIMGKKNMDFRQMVEDFIIEILEKTSRTDEL